MNHGLPASGPGRADAAVGTLIHSLPVRIVEVSGGGCRVEAPHALAEGTAGQVRVVIGGVVHSDDFRIARCQARAGSSVTCQLGMELLNTRRLTPRSLRLAIRKLVDGHRPGGPVVAEEPAPAIDQPRDERAKGVSRAPPIPLLAPD